MAAERLCLYWQERLEAFGPQKAFLPLVFHGGGALQAEDVSDLHAGYPCLLPDATDGSKVMLSDRHKALPTSSPSSRIRCEFYLQSFLARNEAALTHGVNILDVLIIPRFDKQNFQLLDKLTYLQTKVFPLKFHLHFLVLPPIPKAGKRYAVQEVVANSMETVLKYRDDLSGVDVHVERERGQILYNLTEDVKLAKEGIPLNLKVGGTWKTQEFLAWCNSREAMENKQWGTLHKGKSPPARTMTENERKDKRRLADILHSRRKRERKKNRIADMHKDHDTLRARNEDLKKTNKLLLGLLQEAQDIITRVEQGTFTAEDNIPPKPAPWKKSRKASTFPKEISASTSKKPRKAVEKSIEKKEAPSSSFAHKAPPHASFGSASPAPAQFPQELVRTSQAQDHQLAQLLASTRNPRVQVSDTFMNQHQPLRHQHLVNHMGHLREQRSQQPLAHHGSIQVGFETIPQAQIRLHAESFRTPNDQLLGMIAATISSRRNGNHVQHPGC